MSRPIKKRTAKSYRRDVESLVRLHTAIRLDENLPKEKARDAMSKIDNLIDSLKELIELESNR